jgi:uncharacterized protein
MFDVREHTTELLDPACYPETPEAVELIETHISSVFVAGQYVYKLKKPVDFGFVDYSTAVRRRRFCRLEVELNRRLSEGIYLDTVPLVRTHAGLRLEARGRAIDWAVKMQRVPTAALWSTRLAAGELDAAAMERLGRFLADFHGRSVCVRSPSSIRAADRAWDDTLRDLRRFAGDIFPAALLQGIAASGERLRRSLEPLLRRRLRTRRFVDGHGDLRLEHLCELGGRLHALDCVEFSRALRRVDAASDLAFLLMDLDRNGSAGLANDLAAAYLRSSGDASLPLCDRFYRAERALVRAKVDALSQAGDGRPEPALQRLRERAGRWVALATDYLHNRPRPALVVVRGVSGTGKTTLATRLAAEFGLAWLASDYFRKQALGSPLERRLSAEDYTPDARWAVYRRLHRSAGWYLARGFPVLLDATYLDPGEQRAAAAVARRYGVPAVAMTLRLEPALLRERLHARSPSASDANWEVVREQLERSQAALSTGMEQAEIDASGHPAEVLEAGRALLAPLLAAPS